MDYIDLTELARRYAGRKEQRNRGIIRAIWWALARVIIFVFTLALAYLLAILMMAM